ncbi:MAG: exodeoxyribonuclease VII small subunit [Deltaproteobacteria bacterium]|jgi:exodeoxyribonuclease VII small subunit|nr:exodeoxyribonuclease VII small subunit [Deltaproteobacteria bacterium]
MSLKPSNKKTEETFEAGLERLKQLVEGLEKSDISLDEALNGFEEGIKLSRKLSAKLDQAETRLELLTKAADGGLEVSPLEGLDFGQGQDDHEEGEADEDEDQDHEGQWEDLDQDDLS